ncbi:GTPase Era [Fusibacter tunisiensis]|uniref:GTPase Era n=1 Tax=Fusibacter tunisiensis TaxID=1008308 RepID=A0ABS2MMT8_9FIRM|nr:GTPase Era [Fusibacter tunisiensis]MBM7560706.1 GTP-binding protein Era [Fusibacter tunisiensis]
MSFKSGFVTIIGRPNVGKSTLLNRIIGEKIAIMSDKPQTTRHKITAMYNDASTQIIFVDTPGIHRPKSKLGDYMVTSAKNAVKDVDVVILMMDHSLKIGPGDQYLLDFVKEAGVQVILAINKVDLLKPEAYKQIYDVYEKMPFVKEVVGLSATLGHGVKELIDAIKKELPEGPAYYSDDTLTDQTERTIVGEIIREKILMYIQDEIPHGVAVEVQSMKLRPDETLYDIEANIICEKKSHKGIIIGKEGRKLKGIGKSARQDIEKFLDKKVNLQLWVKIREGWRDNQNLLNSLGYKD